MATLPDDDARLEVEFQLSEARRIERELEQALADVARHRAELEQLKREMDTLADPVAGR